MGRSCLCPRWACMEQVISVEDDYLFFLLPVNIEMGCSCEHVSHLVMGGGQVLDLHAIFCFSVDAVYVTVARQTAARQSSQYQCFECSDCTVFTLSTQLADGPIHRWSVTDPVVRLRFTSVCQWRPIYLKSWQKTINLVKNIFFERGLVFSGYSDT